MAANNNADQNTKQKHMPAGRAGERFEKGFVDLGSTALRDHGEAQSVLHVAQGDGSAPFLGFHAGDDGDSGRVIGATANEGP